MLNMVPETQSKLVQHQDEKQFKNNKGQEGVENGANKREEKHVNKGTKVPEWKTRPEKMWKGTKWSQEAYKNRNKNMEWKPRPKDEAKGTKWSQEAYKNRNKNMEWNPRPKDEAKGTKWSPEEYMNRAKKEVKSNYTQELENWPRPLYKNRTKNKDNQKEKSNKGNNKQLEKNVTKSTGSIVTTVLQILFFSFIFVMMFLGFLYIVDVEEYYVFRDRGINGLNSAVNLLPVELVTRGEQMIELARPTVEQVIVKFCSAVGQISEVLNSYPLLKDHWSNISEISSIIGERLAEYMRAVYRQVV